MSDGPAYFSFSDTDLDASAQEIKPATGQLHGWFLSNTTSSKVYVKLYDGASAPTVGTDTPKLTLQVPANGSANAEFKRGISFSGGIYCAATSSVAASDTTDPGASACIANFFYL